MDTEPNAGPAIPKSFCFQSRLICGKPSFREASASQLFANVPIRLSYYISQNSIFLPLLLPESYDHPSCCISSLQGKENHTEFIFHYFSCHFFFLFRITTLNIRPSHPGLLSLASHMYLPGLGERGGCLEAPTRGTWHRNRGGMSLQSFHSSPKVHVFQVFFSVPVLSYFVFYQGQLLEYV